MSEIGEKIRDERKRAGYTIKQLAERLGVSPLTLHRIETGKSSPSVILVSEVAEALNISILSLLEPKKSPCAVLKSTQQKVISTATATAKIIGPRRMIGDNIIVTYGELKKGQSLDPHTATGTEWAYNLEGRCVLTLDGQTFLCEPGDAIAFDARFSHSVTAIDDLKFIGIYLREKR